MRVTPCSRAVVLAGLLMAASAAPATDFNLTGEVVSGTCDWSLGDADRLVVLDPIGASMLPAAGAVGYVTFELHLQGCTPAVRNAVFSFSGTPESSLPSLFGNAGDARGVAVVLESADGQRIGADGSNSERSASVAGQRARLPLRAAYWRLAGQATGVGSVAATAIVTLRYE